MNILLAAEESAGLQMLKALTNSSHRIVAVLASPTGAGTGAANVWDLAQKLGHETWPAKRVKDPALAEEMRARGVDILLNVHSLFIINGEVLSAPRIGSFNIHPGPLPRYAGLNAPSWAIYRGEARHGVTVHKMLPGIDTGPVVYQEMVAVDANETGLSLSIKCVKAGLPLILRLLETAAADPEAIPLLTQDLTKREYFARGVVPNEGWVDWTRPAREVDGFIRACDYHPFPSPWKHPRAVLGGQEVGVLKAALTGEPCGEPPGTVGGSADSGVRVACADEWLLAKKLVVAGRTLNASEVLKPGDQLCDARRDRECGVALPG